MDNTNEDVHVAGSQAHNLAYDDENHPDNGNETAAYEV